MVPIVQTDVRSRKDKRSKWCRPDLFTTSGARRPQPPYLSRPHAGLTRLFGDPDPQAHCKDTSYAWVNRETGETVPALCRRNTCLNAARHKVERLAAAVALAEPTDMVRFSCVPDVWRDARSNVNRVIEYLRRHGRRVEFAYSIERNPSETGCHLHGYMHGDPVVDILGESLGKAGLGVDHHVQPVTHARWLGYPMKQAQHSQRSLDDFLRLNGDLLVHPTRGFWREGGGGGRDRAPRGGGL